MDWCWLRTIPSADENFTQFSYIFVAFMFGDPSCTPRKPLHSKQYCSSSGRSPNLVDYRVARQLLVCFSKRVRLFKSLCDSSPVVIMCHYHIRITQKCPRLHFNSLRLGAVSGVKNLTSNVLECILTLWGLVPSPGVINHTEPQVMEPHRFTRSIP